MNHLIYRINLVLCCLAVSYPLLSAQDLIDGTPPLVQDQIQSVLEDLDEESDFDFNTFTELLTNRLSNPLDINHASREEMKELLFLSDIQINALITHRTNLGNLLDLYELQAVPSWDLQTIREALPYFTINKKSTDAPSLLHMLRNGRNETYLRWSRILEKKKGFKSKEFSEPAYNGSADKLYARYRHRYYQDLSYGLTMEKDPGENLFRTNNQQGFDFYSYHLYIKDLKPHLTTLAIGDFSASMGQGLIMHSGFGRGKGSFVTNIKKGGKMLRPYTSVNEYNFLRGVGVQLDYNPIDITIFGSSKKIDANIVESIDNSEVYFSSIQQSGLHRTSSEQEDKKSIRQNTAGITINYEKNKLSLSLNALHNHFSGILQRSPRLYNKFYFQGSTINNVSVDYDYSFRNFLLFGELATSSNQGLAVIQGLMAGLSSTMDLAILYRNINRKYQTILGNAFTESSTVNNERGIYIGTDIRLSNHWKLSSYFDMWNHPWVRFTADAPSEGYEYLLRLTYHVRRKTTAYLQIRNEYKGLNVRNKDRPGNAIEFRTRRNIRIQFNHKINSFLEWRNRIEFSYIEHFGDKYRGMLVYQDLLFRKLNTPYSFSTRLAYFSTDDYQSRIYAYENDLLYQFSIPAFYGQGLRYYINYRHRLRDITLELRWSQTIYRNQSSISSGNEEILGNKKSEIKFQLRYIIDRE